MRNIVLIGMPGCGKTTIGRALAALTGMGFIDIDEVIEREQQRSILEIFEEDGECVFRRLETETISRVVRTVGGSVIATGGGAVLTEENVQNLKRGGILVFIDRPIVDMAKDINIQSRPLLKDGETALRRLYGQRLPAYLNAADRQIINDKRIEDAVNEIAMLITGG